jgi:hypothetical protein
MKGMQRAGSRTDHSGKTSKPCVPYSAYPPIWTGPGQYDFESLDAQVGDIQKANPGARMLCIVDLNTPHWWVRLRCGRFGCSDTFTNQGETLATKVWREDTRAYMQAFLKHMSERYPDLVAGYVLACGSTTEWLDYSRGEESPPRRIAWRKWMRDRGHEDPVDIPPASIREHLSHGIFRDPVEDALAVEYWRFHAWLVGDAIQYFAAAAQEVLQHRVKVGVFYGYVLELSNYGRVLYRGHLAYDGVFRCKDIDFFVAPGSYFDRQIGGGSGAMAPLGSIRHHGKGILHEIDHRTHTSLLKIAPGVELSGSPDAFKDDDAVVAGLRREFCFALIEGASLWWFDMFGNWYEGERVLGAMKQMGELWERLARERTEPAAEVAMVLDADSMFYVSGDTALMTKMIYKQRAGLSRMGVPYEAISFADLKTIDTSRYKMVLLPNLFVVDDAKKKVLAEKVCVEGKTVVWVYAPGVITNGCYDRDNIETLTGIPGDSTALTVKKMSGWTSVFAPKPNLSAKVLQGLARDAGAHIYSDSLEPLYASDTLVAFHTAKGGEYTFKLPRTCARVTELFSGRVVAEKAAEFSDTIPGPGTVLYELETSE